MYLYFKRLIDISIAILVLIILSPLLIFLSFILLIDLTGNPFFTQSRPGKDEKIFKLIKFKSMNDIRDKTGYLLSDNLRLTKVGNIIRKTSLDEIPQLINVLKGDMSLVGPRPLLVDYLPLYNDFQKRRHEVKPGITGWAQVNGRNAISWDEKFKYDVWYVDNVSFMLDVRILLLTIMKVLKREGINQTGQATADPFKGNIV